ncbi:MAG: PAS domain S-box protein, partial [bacterium]
KNIEDDKLVFKTGKPVEITKHMTSADGRERWFHAVKVPQFDDKGNITGLIGIVRDISKSRKAEEIRKKYEFMANTLNEFMTLVDRNYVYTAVNDAYCRAHNKKREEIIGRTLKDVWGEETFNKIIKGYMDRCFAGEEVHYRENFKFPALGIRCFDIACYPYKGTTGAISHVVVITRDIAESKKAEEKLQESEEHYRSLIEETHDMIQSVAPDGHFIFVNTAWLKILGYTVNDIKNMTVFDIIHPDSLKHCQKLFQKIMSGKTAHNIEAVFVTKNGENIIVEGTAVARKQGNRVIATQGFFRNITERKKAEDMLKDAKEYTANIIESMIDILIVTDSDGKIKTVNQANLNLLGYKKEEIIAQPVGKLFAEEEEEEEEEEEFHMRTFKKIIKEGHITNYRTSLKTASGKEIPVILSGSSLRDEKKNLIGMVIVVKDMAEQDNLQKRMLQQAKLASIGQLAAGVAHELNNPLTTIVAMSDLLSLTLENILKKNDRKNLLMIKEAGLRMKKIIDRLLSFSRPAEKKTGEKVNLNLIIKKVCALFETEIEKERITVEKNLTRIPYVLGDSDRVMEVLINLFSNSMDALKNKQNKKITVATSYNEKEKLLCVKFGDNGKGMSEDVMHRIFEPFFSGKEKKSGTGLGLSIVYEILNNHGGCIEVCSKEGKFTEFVISFSVDSRGRRVIPEKDTGRPGILIVDDDPAVVEFIKESLRMENKYEIFTALDGFQAGQEVAKRNPNLVILDIFLPGIDGFNVCRNIRGRKNGIKIIAITGRDTEENRIKILEAGADAYLIKPFSKANLLKNVESLLSRSTGGCVVNPVDVRK